MTVLIVGFLIGIYWFARKTVKNEPLKSQLDNVFDKTNKKLSLYKNQKPKLLLDILLKISNKGIFYSLILLALSLLFPENIERILILLFSPIILLSMLLSFSISWIQHHKKTLKEYFLNFQMLGLLFSPLIFYYIGKYPINPTIDINDIFKPFGFLISKIGIFKFQLIWLFLVAILLYVGALIIASPIYITLYTLIITTAYCIKIIEKHIDKHILDVIVTIIALIITFMKIWK